MTQENMAQNNIDISSVLSMFSKKESTSAKNENTERRERGRKNLENSLKELLTSGKLNLSESDANQFALVKKMLNDACINKDRHILRADSHSVDITYNEMLDFCTMFAEYAQKEPLKAKVSFIACLLADKRK